jgi:hypothetical protein
MEANKEKIYEDKQVCRATISTTTGEGFDFEAVAVPTVNGQLRYSYENNEVFNQILRINKENIDTSRLDSGLPLFDNHPWDNSAENTLGITTSYIFDERGLVVRAKFGARADQELKDDIKNGIIKTVSIEGTIINYSVVREEGKIPNYFADLWTPESLSFAPVPNDINAQIEIKRALKEQKDKSEVNPHNGDNFLTNIIKKFK